MLLLLLILLITTAVAVAFAFDDTKIVQNIEATSLMKPLLTGRMLHATLSNILILIRVYNICRCLCICVCSHVRMYVCV